MFTTKWIPDSTQNKIIDPGHKIIFIKPNAWEKWIPQKQLHLPLPHNPSRPPSPRSSRIRWNWLALLHLVLDFCGGTTSKQSVEPKFKEFPKVFESVNRNILKDLFEQTRGELKFNFGKLIGIFEKLADSWDNFFKPIFTKLQTNEGETSNEKFQEKFFVFKGKHENFICGAESNPKIEHDFKRIVSGQFWDCCVRQNCSHFGAYGLAEFNFCASQVCRSLGQIFVAISFAF